MRARELPDLLVALSGERPARTPVWFMRQAGRSLPEYRRLRERSGLPMLEACLDPELVVEATLQPVRRHGVDAAILFSDIMVPLLLAGADVRIEPGTGPVVDPPVRTAADVDRLVSGGADLSRRPGGLAAVESAVRAVVARLGPVPPVRESPWSTPGPPRHGREGAHPWTPLLAFGGAPFTLAAYLVEGRPSRDHLAARAMMHADARAWDRLMTWCAQVTGQFIAAQVHSGAAASQLFDSWAGSLSAPDYRERVAPYSRLAIELARQAPSPSTGRTAPLIHFGLVGPDLLPELRRAGGDAIGVDHRTPLDVAARLVGSDVPVQGNIDPAYLFAPAEALDRQVADVLERGRAAPGHVLNLGHGVPPGADPDVLTRLVRKVHAR